jgi:hypothetical protein
MRGLITIVLAAMFQWGATAGAEELAAVPPAAQQSAALNQVRKVYEAEYAQRDAKSQSKLAGKLFAGADETGDATTRYVMLAQAREVAAAAGDASLALAAARRTEGLYAEKPAAATLEAIAELRRASLSPAASGDVAYAALGALDAALGVEDLAAASKLAAAAMESAGRSGDAQLSAAARERAADVRIAAAESGRLVADRKTLAANPTDPKACTAVGRFFCFTLGRWDKGLPLLTHAQDAKLRQLATLDRAPSIEPADALKVADGWFAMAAPSRGLTRIHFLQRAVVWYRAYRPRLTGLMRLRAEKQLAAIGAECKPWDPIAYTLNADEQGIELGLADRNVTRSFLIQLELKTTWTGKGILLTKRHTESDGSLTLELGDEGGVNLYGDASFYKVLLKGQTRVNDGEWHVIRVEKQGTMARLFVDGLPQGTLETRATFESKSPWVIGWHRGWGKGAMEGEIRHVRIQSAN